MHEHRGSLAVPVMLGVGAAFDFLTGRTPQAPRWMRGHGLEWLYRLWKEPRRLWRRYARQNPRFVVAFARQYASEVVTALLPCIAAASRVISAAVPRSQVLTSPRTSAS